MLTGVGAAVLLAAAGATALRALPEEDGPARTPAPRWSGPPGTVPEPLWSYDGATAQPTFGPVDVDGRVCFAGGGGELLLRDPVSGVQRWRGPVVRDLVGGRRPVALGPDGSLLFLDPADGTVRHRTRERVTGLLVADEDQVYALDAKGGVAAFERADGGVRWRVSVPVPSTALSAAAGHGHLILSSAVGGVVALSATDGSPVWRRPTNGSRAALSANAVLLGGAGDRTLTCLDRERGEPLWTLPADDGAGFGVPTPAGDDVYVADGRQLRSVDVKTGESRWTVLAAEELARDQAPLVAGSGIFAPLRRPELGILVVHRGRAAEQYVFAPAPAGEVRADVSWRGAVVAGNVIWQRGGTVRALPGM
ncbi:PQQ-binding-like beta-propeller repeat protein [Streptomyces sp. NPDC002033]|uniref:outer membrane protein assembly factor BamB family protein n=1 Tax=Streptomyces sp. NPDC002033 TaxID=3154533 RepID=UPI00332CACC2